MMDRRADRAGLRIEGVDLLETRELLTGGLGSQFAAIPATVSAAGGTGSAQFTLDPTLFHRPRGTMLLGIDVSAGTSSTLQPRIVAVTTADGKALSGLERGTYTAAIQTRLGGKTEASAVLVPIPKSPHGSRTLTVEVQGLNGTTGAAEVGFYLPGDSNGDGKVDKTDLAAIKAAEGANFGDAKYTTDADANRDGTITNADNLAARRNLGVSTTLLPALTDNVAASTPIDARTRTAATSQVTIEGTATPNSLVKLDELQNRVKLAGVVVNASGGYSLTTTLAPGENDLVVTSADGFGQTFRDSLLPIRFNGTTTAK